MGRSLRWWPWSGAEAVGSEGQGSIVGPPVRADIATRTLYATDNSIYQIRPDSVAFPASADEVSALLSANHLASAPQPIVARGGGTGTNGQALTDGVVLDLKRRFNRIIEIDEAARIAVVDPGVVVDALNAELAPTGLLWAPHASTVNRATVGGMIATDAAGKGSAVHGRTHRHVAALDLCLPDGTLVHLGPIPVVEAERRATADTTEGRLWRSLLALDVPPVDRLGLPEGLGRAFTGYGIDRLRHVVDDGLAWIDPVHLVVGAEGTLGVVTRAWLRLTPVPHRTVLAALAYDSFPAALRDALRLTEQLAPTAIETFDDNTIEAARHASTWSALANLVGEDPGAVLLVEFDEADSGAAAPLDAATIAGRIRTVARCQGVGVVEDAATRQAVWRVRAEAVGLLAGRVDDRGGRVARPTALVEDCAVPPSSMPDFIAEFRALLDEAGLRYGMFGHADVGCVHVRPSLDLTDDQHRRLVLALTEGVADLVDRYGGVLWGEHGRGFRGDQVARSLPAETIALMRQVKSAFDPLDLCNPGKLYRPLGSDLPLTAVDEAPLRADRDRSVAVATRRDFASAFACNGNGLCHDHDPSRSMCPSWSATGDPALSPKGRADLLRARLAASGAEREALDTALVDNLSDCLSCSACSGSCPVQVDIPELKSRFLAEYYQGRRRPLAHLALSHLEFLAPRSVGLPSGVTRVGAALLERLLGLIDLPTPTRATGSTVSRPTGSGSTGSGSTGSGSVLPGGLEPVPTFRPGSEPERLATFDVVLLADVFISTLNPAVSQAAVSVLRAAGSSVASSPVTATGKFDYNIGRRDRFRRAASRQRRLVEQIVAAGARPVTIEPAVSMLHRHEYPNISDGYPTGRLVTLADEVARAVDNGDLRFERAEPKKAALFGHCTEQALAPEQTTTWARLLTAAGYQVEEVATGCCGMAGAFGYDRSKQTMSRRLWDQTWAVPVAAAQQRGELLVATGYSCRSQAKRFGPVAMRHPIELLAARVVSPTSRSGDL